MIKKLLFSRSDNAAFSRRQVFRTILWTWSVGIIMGFALIFYTAPLVEDVREYMGTLGTVHAENDVQVPFIDQPTQQEKIDQYTDEAYSANEDLYRNHARLEAIERVEAELEVEKESLRSAELEGLSFE